MLPSLSSLSRKCALLAPLLFASGLLAQDVLFFTGFEEDTVGETPSQSWASTTNPATGSALVAEDLEDDFGSGTGNKFYRAESARNYDLVATFEGTDVLTLSYDYITRFRPEDGSRSVNMNMNVRTGVSNDHRVHVSQINATTNVMDKVSSGANGIVYRFDLAVNNSSETITYEKPDASGLASLGSGLVSLWQYTYATHEWKLLSDAYTNHRSALVQIGDKMIQMDLQVDSNPDLRSFDLDNVYVFKGAVPGNLLREADVSLPVIPYPEVAVLKVDEDFEQYDGPREILEVTDYQGPFTMNQVKTAGNGGTVHIVKDTENRFGRGSENLVLYMDNVQGTQLDIPIGGLETGVATVAFDMYHEGVHTGNQTNRLGARFHAGTLANSGIVHNFGFQATGGSKEATYEGPYYVRGFTSKVIHPDYVQRWVVVRNNTRDSITYDTPNGPLDLGANGTHLWLNGFLFNSEYNYGSSQPEQLITGFRFDAFNHWTAYFDNIRVWEGAVVPEAEVPARDSESVERELLVYESFDYPAGSVEGLDGGIGWAGGYTAMDGFSSAEVVDVGMEWPWLAVAGNRLRAAGPTLESTNADGVRNFRVVDIDGIHSSLLNPYSGGTHIAPPGGSIWISVLGEGNPDQTATFWGLSLYRDTSEQSGEVLFLGKGTGDTEETGWRFTGGGGSTTSGAISTEKSLENKHFWVIRIDYRDDGKHVANLFHNPSPNGPAPTEPLAIKEPEVGSLGFDRIRIAGNGAGFSLGEFRVGTTWEAVSPVGDAPPPATDYYGWVASYFPGESNSDLLATDADPDGDGVANLLEYLFGMNPSDASREGLPVVGVETITVGGFAGNYLTLTGTLADDAEGLGLHVEVGSDLSGWEEEAILVESVSNGDGTTTYTYRDPEALDANARRFIRFNVLIAPK